VATRERSEILNETTLTKTFQLLDKDNDGLLTVKDLQASFDKSQRHSSSDLFKVMIERALTQAGMPSGTSINLLQFKTILITNYETIKTEAQ